MSIELSRWPITPGRKLSFSAAYARYPIPFPMVVNIPTVSKLLKEPIREITPPQGKLCANINRKLK